MSAWTYTTPPDWFPTAIAVEMGWKNPTTGELLVAISNFTAKNTDVSTAPTIVGVTLNDGPLVTDETLLVVVEFSEAVVAFGTPRIEIQFNGETRWAQFDAGASTPTHVAFSYLVTAEDVAAAGEVTLGTIIDKTNGSIADVLPGGGVQAIPSILGIEPSSTLVSFN